MKTLDAVIEIPKGSRNKYEYDHEKHVMRLDRRLFSAMTYPADYGFVPDTLAEDGDPLDVLVLLDEPTFPGCFVAVRPIGILWMTDEKGPDAKLICVADGDPTFAHVDKLEDISPALLAEIDHFFDVYKMLEPGKESNTDGYGSVADAWAEIEASLERFAATPAATH